MVGATSSLDMLQLYMGNGSLLLLFVLTLVYLWATEKNKGIKALFVYLSIGILAVFLFPPFASLVVDYFGEGEVYYRILWLLPIGIVIPYGLVRFVKRSKKKWVSTVVVILACVYIAIGGNPVYNAPQLSKSQNLYQIPDEVIEICDEIVVPGREVKAVFPHELVQYVRQYTPYVVLEYGYDAIVERWDIYNALESEMRKEISSAAELSRLCRETHTHYIVVSRHHLIEGSLEEEGFREFYRSASYIVYLDSEADLSVP